jgi:hypothetical protein
MLRMDEKRRTKYEDVATAFKTDASVMNQQPKKIRRGWTFSATMVRAAHNGLGTASHNIIIIIIIF